MSLKDTKKKSASKQIERPSLLISLRLIDTEGLPLDENLAWEALNKAFESHPYYRVYQATIRPDKELDKVF